MYDWPPTVYYDDWGRVWILERTWLHEKLASERWVRAREYDKKRQPFIDNYLFSLWVV